MAAPNPPTGVTQSASSETTITVSWSAPVGGTPPTDFYYFVDGEGPSTVGLTTEATLIGLAPGTSYVFEVQSVNADGFSERVPLVVATRAVPTPHVASPCFAPVRGSAIRVTSLTSRGQVPSLVEYVTSKSVIKIAVTEVIESGNSEIIKNPDEKRRLRIIRNPTPIRHKVDIEFLRVDPEMLRLVAGVDLVYKRVDGFGLMPFGIAPFGDSDKGDVVGFDSGTNLRATSFALEVWSKLDNASARPTTPLTGFDDAPFDTEPFDTPNIAEVATCGIRRWGYTLFPFLRGGRLSGFTFENGLVSFNLIGAQTRRNPGWGVGPHDLTGPFQRLESPVSRNTSWRMFVTEAQPPAEACGVQYLVDVIDNGTPDNPMPDPDAVFSVDAGGVTPTDGWIIDGGAP